MRAVVWNLSHWQKAVEQRQAAWSAVETLGDFGLLQETVPPHDVTNVVYRPIGGRRDWGSAVVGFGVPVSPLTHAKGRSNHEPRPLSGHLPGSVAVATVGEAGAMLTAVSMYGLIDDGYADTTVQRHLSDLAPLFDSAEHENRLLLAGDLNITTQWKGDEARYRPWDAAVFTRIRAFGLRDCLDAHRSDGPLDGCDCLDGLRCRHIRTQYHRHSSRPWQNDYAFASESLLPKVKSATVVDDAALRELSDHLPIVIEFDLSAGA